MPSSLAAQLAQSTSLNSALLVDRTRRKPTQSYLFTGRDADKHDLESMYALALNAFMQLRQWNPALQAYEDGLFSDAAKGLDRTLLPRDEAIELDVKIAGFLSMLGKDLMEVPTGRVLEWLVRRFRINEFNVKDVLLLFLPYHDTPHFAKMVTILHVKPDVPWGFLTAYKSAAQNVPRVGLVTEMLRNVAVARFVASALPKAVKERTAYRTLVAFHTGVLLEYISRSKALDDGVLAFLLPAMLEQLQESAIQADTLTKDIVLSSYVLLSALSQKCVLQSAAIEVIVNAMASCSSRVVAQQFVNAVMSVLSPQDQLEALPDTFVQAVLELPDVEGITLSTLAWSGSEKLIAPLIFPLVERLEEPTAYSLLSSLISSTSAPINVLATITGQLMDRALEGSPSPTSNSHRLLVSLQQRYPTLVQDASRTIIRENEDQQDVVEQLILSLSVKTSQGGNTLETDMVIASMDVNGEIRAAAVQNILHSLRKPSDPESTNLESMRSALLARVHDSNLAVLNALYSEPSTILPVFLSDPSAFIDAVSEAVSIKAVQSSRQILRAHLSFLASYFLPAVPQDVVEDALSRAIFPFLLFSKPKYRTAQAVWEIVEAAQTEVPDAGLAFWGARARKDKSASFGFEGAEVMCRVNLAIASRMAETILVSNKYTKHFGSLLQKLSYSDPHARNLAYLVARALLGILSGENQVDAAQGMLDAMALTTLDGMEGFMKGADHLQEFLNDKNLGTNVVLKPQSRNTHRWLQTSLLCLMPIIPRPSGDAPNYTASTQTGGMALRQDRFVQLMRAVYRIANSSSSLPPIPASLLRAQFIHLADDALAFLVGVWLTEEDAGLRRAALSHALAFIAAHEVTEHAIDFQTVLPALFVALGDADRGVRHQASGCVQLLARLSMAKQASGVYAFDTIYGKDTSQLTYLGWDDYQKYLEALAEYREHCVHDPNYIRAVHQQYLARDPSDKKKSIAHKRHVVQYLLSHVAGSSLPAVKLSLLALLEQVSDRVKAPALAPTVQALTDKTHVVELESLFGSRLEDFAAAAVSALDASASVDLNDASGSLWPVFLDALRYYFQPKSLASPREALANNLQNGLFARLTTERQKELCEIIITIGSTSSDAKSYCISLLAKLLSDASLLIQLLIDLQPKPKDVAHRSPKRTKVNDVNAEGAESLNSLAFLAEVLSGTQLPGDKDLVVCLLEVLGNVAHAEGQSPADVTYIEQLLMSSIENASSSGGATFTGVRLDILVDIIRASESPQTFNQALLLIASLARVAPESVLHNIMPVFTFMGSNVFHRDDTYSFRVVQKTIDNIIPLMVSSLKEKHASRDDLLLASREFLRVFTDATNHIPRHRRTQFFIHLVDALGPEEFLSVICMLIVAKADKRVVRLQGKELHAALALPLSLVQHYSPHIQLSVLIELLDEAQRLILAIISPDYMKTDSILLSDVHDDEHASQVLPQLKRRAHALVAFAGVAFEGSSLSSLDNDHGRLNKLVSALLEISSSHNIPSASAEHGDVADIALAARLALAECIRSMRATHFVALPSVSAPVREEVSPTIIAIATETKRFIPLQDGNLVTQALRALKAISLSVVSGEEASLVECLPLIVAAAKSEQVIGAVVLSLPSLCTALGPRIIPYFRDIIQLAVRVLRDSFNVIQDDGASITRDALDVLRAVFDTIPAFWGASELGSVFGLYFDALASGAGGEIGSFVKRVAAKAPTGVLLSTYFETWPSMPEAPAEASSPRRSLRAAQRPPVLEHIRPAFKVFLEGFDLRSRRRDAEVSKIEGAAVAAFVELVTKLNDTAFRPLFRRLFDWAFTVAESSIARKVAFCNAYIALMDYFKSLMTPYLSFLLPHFLELLQVSDAAAFGPTQLCVVQTLSKSLSVDEGTFWRDDRLQQVLPALLALMPHAATTSASDEGSRDTVSASLSALCDAAGDDALLQRLNLGMLLHTRYDDVRVRVFALQCARALWAAHGGKLIGFVAETATFVAECAEDEHDGVVRATHQLKAAVEGTTGESIESV
ncbi:hypothetical protein BC834DRAFT_967272 [Gloeopeniophorella convolvens]|nr:hypothetical protein BC834DRAFT_967272 [Gloeopeniophorella convolvens]